ncbi:MFS transporter [Tepidibacillus marianensis]|uniref:MFS transporter n=1 Tax=Tepidibacillus marianensis TaxID=3131995 RepID=UPI0030D02908
MTELVLEQRRNTYFRLSSFYYIYFFGMGALYPLLSVYFKDHGLTGSQLGLVMSIGPILSIVTQPIWGMLCDRYGIQKKVLLITLVAAGLASLIFPSTQSFWAFFILIGVLNIFQSAVVPITDNISMNFVQRFGGQYGDIRLWGSLGFAMAVWMAGILSDHFQANIIFYLYAISFFLQRSSQEECRMKVRLFQ